MRNLKRVLSLALASAMLFGMMVMGAAAADKKASDLTDSDKITNKEAVTLLVDLGIVEGKTDGSYAPAETVNRATMAKLITVMMMGNVDQNAFKGTATDLTDINGHWAEGYIKYCYSNKIIAGDGAGHFFPDEPVTTVQAAKMLLVAMGYNALDRKYEKDTNWSVNIMKDAQTTVDAANKTRSLTAGLSVKATDPLSRDNAAQMIFNTLFVRTVSPSYQWDNGTQYIQSYTKGGTLAATIYNVTERTTGLLNAVNGDGYANVGAKGTADSTVVNNSTDKVKGSIADLGKEVVIYKSGSKILSSAAVPSTNNKVVALPGGLTEGADKTVKGSTAKWLADNGLALDGTNLTIVDYAANGEVITQAMLAINNNATIAYVVDVDGDGKVDVLVKNTVTVATITGDVKTKTTGDETTVYVPGVTGTYVKVNGYTDLKKDDIVMYSVHNSVYNITKCESFNGKITGQSGAKLVIDGTAYTISSLAFNGYKDKDQFVGKVGYGKEATFWKDANGNLVYGKLVSGTVTTNLAMVLGYQQDTADMFGNQPWKAQVLKTDGTVEIIAIDKVTEGTSTVSATTSSLEKYDFISYSENTDKSYNATVFNTTAATVGGVSYVIPAAAYSTDYTNGSSNTVIDNASDKATKILNNQAKFLEYKTYSGSIQTAYPEIGNSATIFLVAQYDSSNKPTGYKAYNGISAMPSMADATAYVLRAGDMAKIVFVEKGTGVAAENAGNILYLPSDASLGYVAKDGDTAAYWTYTGFVDGTPATVKMTDSAKNSVSAGNVYFTSVDGDMITGAKAITEYTEPDNKIGVKYDGGVVAVGTSESAAAYYTVTDDTKVYVIDKTNKVMTAIAASAIETDSNDKISVKANALKADQADVIVIEKAAVAGATAFSAAQHATYASGTAINLAANAGVNDVTSKVAESDKVSFKITAPKGAIVTVSVNGTSKTETVKASADNVTFDALYTATADDAAVASGSVVYTVTVTVTDGTSTPIVNTYTLKNIS